MTEKKHHQIHFGIPVAAQGRELCAGILHGKGIKIGNTDHWVTMCCDSEEVKEEILKALSIRKNQKARDRFELTKAALQGLLANPGDMADGTVRAHLKLPNTEKVEPAHHRKAWAIAAVKFADATLEALEEGQKP